MDKETGYTHPKGKGAGKYNGMKLAGDWEGKRIRATRNIRNRGGDAALIGTKGTVESAHRRLSVWFDVCEHCGTRLSVNNLDYSDIELDQ